MFSFDESDHDPSEETLLDQEEVDFSHIQSFILLSILLNLKNLARFLSLINSGGVSLGCKEAYY